MIAAYTDTPSIMPGPRWRVQDQFVRGKRSGCFESDRVFGHTYSLMRFPFKLIAFERHPSELYDLSWDVLERSDVAAQQPERTAALERELAELTGGTRLAPPDATPLLSPEVHDALEALGYTQ